MYRIKAHTGDEIDIPANSASDHPYFSSMDQAAIDYYHEYGYVVLRKLLPTTVTQAARQAWADQIKRFGGYIYRQTTSRPERNRFNDQGYVENPILNVQSLDRQAFGSFRTAALACLTHPNLQNAVTALFGDRLKIVQSMYFEGNTATAPHQDTFYLDSEQIGEMCAAWLALEDIAPNAGRFFICPGSHRIDIKTHGGDFDIAGDSARYQALVLGLLSRLHLEVRAPALQEGDVLLWNSRTIHGSLESPDATSSRQSLTAHFIPRRSRFLQLRSRIKPLTFAEVDGVQVAMIKDQASLTNRLILRLETTFPFIYQPLKDYAVRRMAKRT